jgi:hypothetical protein
MNVIYNHSKESVFTSIVNSLIAKYTAKLSVFGTVQYGNAFQLLVKIPDNGELEFL